MRCPSALPPTNPVRTEVHTFGMVIVEVRGLAPARPRPEEAGRALALQLSQHSGGQASIHR
eukprot:12331386-Alexandrium_andersonii.AAC.1